MQISLKTMVFRSVTAQGRAIGINTFKQLTHKFEGLGFAISITVAFDAFDAI